MAVTGVEAGENLDHPALELAGGEGLVGLGGVGDDGGQVGSEELKDEDGVLVFAPEVLVQNHDVWGALEELQRVDFSEGGLVVVDFLEGHGEAVGEATATVDVGVGSRPDPLHDLVFCDDLGSGVDAPALRWRIHLHHTHTVQVQCLLPRLYVFISLFSVLTQLFLFLFSEQYERNFWFF